MAVDSHLLQIQSAKGLDGVLPQPRARPGTVTHSALPGGSSGPPMPLFLTSCTQEHISLSAPYPAHAPDSDALSRQTSCSRGATECLYTSKVRPAGERPQPSIAVTFLEDASKKRQKASPPIPAQSRDCLVQRNHVSTGHAALLSWYLKVRLALLVPCAHL